MYRQTRAVIEMLNIGKEILRKFMHGQSRIIVKGLKHR